MELSHWVVMVSAQVQRQTNKTASEMLSSCLKFKLLPFLKLSNKSITTIRLLNLPSQYIFIPLSPTDMMSTDQ